MSTDEFKNREELNYQPAGISYGEDYSSDQDLEVTSSVLLEEKHRIYKHSAFISYSHKDSQAARNLKKYICKFGVPDEFLGTKAPFGIIGKHVPQPFLDRSHLPAGEELGASIKVALEESAALIILCSPSSASSAWVAKEIEAFLTSHPYHPCIIPVVPSRVDGHVSVHDCLNPRYQQFFREHYKTDDVDPIVLDMRRGKDGELNAFRRLMATLLGRGPNELSRYGLKGVRLRRHAVYILRWIFLLPAAYLAETLARIVWNLGFFLGGVPPSPLWDNLALSVASVSAFLYAGYHIAPSHKMYTLISLSVLTIFTSGFGLALTIATDPGNGPQYVTLAANLGVSLYAIIQALRGLKGLKVLW